MVSIATNTGKVLDFDASKLFHTANAECSVSFSNIESITSLAGDAINCYRDKEGLLVDNN